jgi:hypothetical protein
MDWKELLQDPNNAQLLAVIAEQPGSVSSVTQRAAARVADVVNNIVRDMDKVIAKLQATESHPESAQGPLPILSAQIASTLWAMWKDKEKAGLGLHEGYLVHVPHTWFSLHVPVEVVDDPRYTWLIDPSSHGIHAPYLIIAPGSPFQISYAGQRIDEGTEIAWEV